MAKLRWKKLREVVKQVRVVAYLSKRSRVTKSLSIAACRAETVAPQSKLVEDDQFWTLLRTKWQEKHSLHKPEENEAHVQKCRECALNIFLMLLVDGIPEGILMGFMASSGFLSSTFVLSLLVANFPEAFAGSTLLVGGGFPTYQTLGMWTGLMLLVAGLAGISCSILLEYGSSHQALHIELIKAMIEGLAGGAMISGIAAVMLPEAFEKSDKRGWIIQSSGFLCTVGFLMSVGLKTMLG